MAKHRHPRRQPRPRQRDLPHPGQAAPAFSLVSKALADVTLGDFAGKTQGAEHLSEHRYATCATSVRKFNERASQLANTVVLCISADLLFAQARFCGAEGLENVVTLSTMRGREFLRDYGVELAGGPLAGVSAVPWWFSTPTTRYCTANSSAKSRTSRTTKRQ